jgi:FlaA1/EpsC-like NDP-sugar epimerase
MIRRSILRFIEKNYRHKPILAAMAEMFIFTGILFASYWIRLGGIDESYLPQIVFLASVYVPLKLFVFWAFRLYKVSFRYFSLYDLIEVLKAAVVSAAFLSFIGMVFRDFSVMDSYPRSVVFIDFLLTFLASAGLRFGYRIFYSANYGYHGGKRVLIAGAGDAGVRLLKETMTASRESSTYIPVAFIDDDPAKLGSIIRGTRVAGNRTDIPRLVKELDIEGIIISIPSATAVQISAIVECAREAGLEHIKIMPGISDVLTGKVTIGDFKEVSSGDFLGRDSVRVEAAGIAAYIKGKRVMVTGAGGSIGSELCRQISNFEPGLLIMLGRGDTELFYINQEMRDKLNAYPPSR